MIKKELAEFDRNEKASNKTNEMYINIGKNFKKGREARGLTKEDMATRIFKTVDDITLIEAGYQRISRIDLHRAIGFLGITLTDLYGDDIEISNNSPVALYRERCADEVLDYLAKMPNDEMRFYS